jgi:hypothetical protein
LTICNSYFLAAPQQIDIHDAFFNRRRVGGTGILSAILTFSHSIQRAKASAIRHIRCGQLSSTVRTRHHDEVPCSTERFSRSPTLGARLR